MIGLTVPQPIPIVGSSPALDVRGASKTFGTQRVLHDVALQIQAGEVRALVGENGSGKSTLVKILAGYHIPDEGASITVGGRSVTPHQPGASDDAGLRFVHQELALVGSLSTVENLGLGRGYGSRSGGPIRWAQRRRDAQGVMADLGYHFDVRRPIIQLEASERTAVAVARAVSPHRSPPQVLVLDEPTANLPGVEVARLFALVRRVRDSGIAILFISHHLNEVFDLADSVTVLRGGTLVATKPVSEVTETGLIEMMVGHEVSRSRSRPASPGGQVLLSVDGLGGHSVHGIDLRVTAGEIVGVAGITGSGREALASLLFGGSARQGSVSVDGTALPPNRPDLSIKAGMALIPADRNKNAVIHGHDVSENLSIARPADFVRGRVFRRRLESVEVSTWLRRLDVRPPEPRKPLSQLSGGNAQKVVLARWLRLTPKVLILDEPTQGVDVGAKEDIHQRIEDAAAHGCAVIVCSTDSEELARLCTRVVVLVRGRIRAESTAPLHADEITAASLADTTGAAA